MGHFRNSAVVSAVGLAGALALTGCSGSTTAGSGSPASTPAASSAAAPGSGAPGTGASGTGATSPSSSGSLSSGSTSSPGPSSGTTSASPTAGNPASSSPAVTSGLGTVVVTADDLPATWRSSGYQPDPSDTAASAALAACTGSKNTDPDRTQTVHSDVFTLGNATVSSEASRYRSQSDITSDIADLKNPRFASCYRSLVRTELTGAGGKVGTVSLTVHRAPAAYPSNVAATLDGRVDVAANGTTMSVYLTAVLITGTRLEAEVDFVGLGAAIPAPLRTKVGTALAARARTI